jgi:predicted nuclease of predicted toxin-antitoxin system
MKLLFDENLSPKLLVQIADLFPDSENALLNGLAKQGDAAIWEYARTHRFMIVTTDRDFRALLDRWGHPPKVVLLESWTYPTRHCCPAAPESSGPHSGVRAVGKRLAGPCCVVCRY